MVAERNQRADIVCLRDNVLNAYSCLCLACFSGWLEKISFCLHTKSAEKEYRSGKK